jgi:uncharacterized membrane protein YecN with MAPEG domain
MVAWFFFQDQPVTDPAANAAAAGLGIGMIVVWLVLVVLMIAGMWKMFEKAGKPGWAAIIPIYNIIVLLEISGKPAWWVILFFIPLVNFVVVIIAYLALAKKFGKGAGYAFGLLLLPPVFLPMLGFGDSRYDANAV